MNTLLVVALIVMAVGVFVILKLKRPAQETGLSYETRETLFTPAERSFLGVLEQALDSRYRVFGKVRLGDMVKPAKGLSVSKRTIALNKINKKHLDFVVCTAGDLAVVGVVELDDKSHEKEDRAERDDFVDQALTLSRIPVVHFPVQKAYVLQEIRTKLLESFRIEAETPTLVMVNGELQPAQPVNPEPLKTGEKSAQSQVETGPVCPKCGATMVKRQAKTGPHAGEWFWACSTYPQCRQVVAIVTNM